MKPLTPVHTFDVDGCSSQIYHGNTGYGLPKHSHEYSHVTYVASGSIVIRKEGIEKVMDKHSRPVNLTAAEWHEIEVLESDTAFINVFSEPRQ